MEFIMQDNAKINKSNTLSAEELSSLSDIAGRFEDCSEAVWDKPNFAKLDNLSCHRENIIQWYPFKEGASVLELCAECGAVTGGFAGRAGRVLSITDSEEKAKIIRTRYGSLKNLEVAVGGRREIVRGLKEKFDYIIFVGPRLCADELCEIRETLADGGKLLIAAENRNGLKYLSGCRDSATGGYYDGIDGYRFCEEQTYDLPRWKKVLNEAGFGEFTFRYPYPDHRFCETVYSDAVLPEKNRLIKNIRNFDGSRLFTFDESSVYNTLIENGIFPLFSNSFFIETGKPCGVIYTKFSKERIPRYRIFTSIIQTDNVKSVRKYSACPEALAHIGNLGRYRERLCKIYGDGEFHIADCETTGDYAEFEFINGEALSNKIDSHIAAGDFDGLYGDIDILKKVMAKISSSEKFVPSGEFKDFFGDIALPDNLTASAESVVDLIADNVIINDKINLIDYEWFLPFSVPVEFIMFRSLFLSGGISTLDSERKKKLYSYAGVDYALFDTFLKMEIMFQQSVSSEKSNLQNVLRRMGNPVYDLRHIDFDKALFTATLYDETGNIIVRSPQSGSYASISAVLDRNYKTVVFEPSCGNIYMQKPKITAVKDGREITVSEYRHNADHVKGEDLCFCKKPAFEIDSEGFDKIRIEYTVYLRDSSLVENAVAAGFEKSEEIIRLRDENRRLAEAYTQQEQMFKKYRETHLINGAAVKKIFSKKGEE